MARTFVVRTVDQALEVLRTAAQDGDTIRLVGHADGMYSKLAVESTAMGLGLEVVVEREAAQGFVIDLLPSVSHKEV